MDMRIIGAYHRSRDDQHQTRVIERQRWPRESTFLQTSSRQVSSNQRHLHPRLPGLVQKHLDTTCERPIAHHNRVAYQRLADRLQQEPAPLVLDSFCGTGHSSTVLARRFPDHLVVGVDKSAHRLARHPEDGVDNTLLLQADCEDIWQLLANDGHHVAHHYLLYPNPWPKAKHLQRRVHGHASLPLLLQLEGAVTLRSNWQLYVEEFGVALHLAGRHGTVSRVGDEAPMTLFERKYRESGHTLWQYRAPQPHNSTP